MNIFKKLWKAEPIVAGLVGNALFLPGVIYGAAALGHPLSDPQQKLLMLAAGALTTGAVRQTVTAPDTLAQMLKDVAVAQLR